MTYLVANAPLIYSLRYVHGLSGTLSLWGYAPNQFLYLVVFYPFAALMTLVAMYSFVAELNSLLPLTSRLRPVFDNWPVAVLIGIILAAFISIVVYLTSAWSFDKLQPQYARKALEAVAKVEEQVEAASLKKEEQSSFRQKLIREAKQELRTLQIPSQNDTASVDQWLDTLKPEVYLQVVQDGRLTQRLRLLNPALHALNVFQLLNTLFMASCALVVAVFCIYAAREMRYDGTNIPELTQTINAAFYAVFFFGLYAVCYHQYRSQIEEVVGTGTTILQDVFVGIIVLVMLVWLRWLVTNNLELSVETSLKFLPVVIFGISYVAGNSSPQILKQLIGSETNVGIQIVLSLIAILLASIPVIRILTAK